MVPLSQEEDLDSLIDRLREPARAAHRRADLARDDDIQFVKDLGLMASGPTGLEIANPIYREAFPRALA